MLGETNGGSGQIEALGGDAIDQLLSRIKGDADGGNGAGNGNGGGNGDGGGGDPMRQPIDGKILLSALKQMADFTSQVVLSSMDKQTDFSMKTAERLNGEIAEARTDGLELNQQLHTT